MPNPRTVYALYKGDKFIDMGTSWELAERRGVTRKSIRNLVGKYYANKVKDKKNRLVAVPIGTDQDEWSE